MTAFSPREATLRGTVVARGAIERVFPLFSPVGEKLWVPGWEPELLYPQGVEWERGQIFRTREPAGEAIWIVTRLDRERHEVEYHRVEPRRYVARIEVACRSVEREITEVSVSYTFIGLTDSGNGEIDVMSQEAYDAKLERWTGWIRAYLDGR